MCELCGYDYEDDDEPDELVEWHPRTTDPKIFALESCVAAQTLLGIGDTMREAHDYFKRRDGTGRITR